jgi:hypothetical protein
MQPKEMIIPTSLKNFSELYMDTSDEASKKYQHVVLDPI